MVSLRELGKAVLKEERDEGKLKKFLRVRKERRAVIRGIEAEERARLQREFVRKKVRRQLAKKFTPEAFQLGEARRKRELGKLQARTQQFAGPFGGRSAGQEILENLGGFGVKGVAPVQPVSKPIKRKKGKKPRSITISLG